MDYKHELVQAIAMKQYRLPQTVHINTMKQYILARNSTCHESVQTNAITMKHLGLPVQNVTGY